MKCGIKHGFSDQTCIREKWHAGPCRSKTKRLRGGALAYSEWESRDGKFYRHIGYQTIYPKNAKR